MLQRIKSWFASRDLAQASRVKLEAKRRYWREALIAAESRGDTRAQGFAIMQLRQATTEALRWQRCTTVSLIGALPF